MEKTNKQTNLKEALNSPGQTKLYEVNCSEILLAQWLIQVCTKCCISGSGKMLWNDSLHSIATSTMYAHMAMLCISDRLSKKKKKKTNSKQKWLFCKTRKFRRRGKKQKTGRECDPKRRMSRSQVTATATAVCSDRAAVLTWSQNVLHVSCRPRPPNLWWAPMRQRLTVQEVAPQGPRAHNLPPAAAVGQRFSKGLIGSPKIPNA